MLGKQFGFKPKWMNKKKTLFALLALTLLSGCPGEPVSSNPETKDMEETGDVAIHDLVDLHKPTGTHVIRRLSIHEMELTLKAITGLTPTSLSLIPPDSKGFTFDRMVSSQTMSRSHFDAFFNVAKEVSQTLNSSRKCNT